MTAVMKGLRIIEVAEHALVPVASAVLADWGAEVIKIEPLGRGDASRGLTSVKAGGMHVMHHHSNRGKRSLALDLSVPESREILYRLVETADVFLTNKLPRVRAKLRIEVDDIRARNPNIVYVRGTGLGEHGPQADRGSYDLLAFWHRSGASMATRSPEGQIPFLPAPGFGDSLGAMTIAGGIMGALFHRERAGEAPVVDVSLLATGMWAMSGAISVAIADENWKWPPALKNPLSEIYATGDGRWIALCCLQAGHYWPYLCEAIGRPELAEDPRFQDHESLLANAGEAAAILTEVFAERTLEEWSRALEGFIGQWSPVQEAREVAADPQVDANGYLQPCVTAEGDEVRLVAPPVQYNGQAPVPGRGPDYNEHGDEILGELGFDWDAVIDLKLRGVVA
ncbi:CoA transferase [Frankia sp. CNm7]|uniref:CoA transferase n=1 Tax=Frankia nepalensis TaxID=1836974 RepID=A0A937RM50_9ACTN|nr:CoA transferase [Frankia nepalensis]MBL7500991.1 CoA transferase [Frankia nepalensis]MBL7512463.1 CoA transferase [Frankia nepalensis]MBL7521528.1 CoA transferase [Frankia nepalensis]MBL7632765.1 CoA transferase [Frankia nepalensis]